MVTHPGGVQMPREVDRRQTKGAELLKARFGLTAAEARVAFAVADGLSYAEIGEALGISSHTVHTHIKEIHRKLQVHTNLRAAALIRRIEKDER